MNKNTKETIKEFITQVLKKANVCSFEFKDFDDDINFFVIPKINKRSISVKTKLKFLLYCSNEKSLTLYCPILYSVKEDDSIMYTLNTINKINSTLAIGKIYLNKENNSVIAYVNRMLFNNIFKELTPELLNGYMDAFLLCCINFYSEMKVEFNE